jgi:hypothetical protein
VAPPPGRCPPRCGYRRRYGCVVSFVHLGAVSVLGARSTAARLLALGAATGNGILCSLVLARLLGVGELAYLRRVLPGRLRTPSGGGLPT